MTQPIIPPPPGKTSNLEHPEDVLHTVNLVTQLLCIIFSTIIVILRFIIRIRIHKTFVLEDCTCVLGQYMGLFILTDACS